MHFLTILLNPLKCSPGCKYKPAIPECFHFLPGLFCLLFEGKFHCPVTFRVFNENTHIVAVKPTGNVFSYDVSEYYSFCQIVKFILEMTNKKLDEGSF